MIRLTAAVPQVSGRRPNALSGRRAARAALAMACCVAWVVFPDPGRAGEAFPIPEELLAPAVPASAAETAPASGGAMGRLGDRPGAFPISQETLDLVKGGGGGGYLPSGFNIEGGITEVVYDEGKPVGVAILNYGSINGPDISLTARNLLVRMGENGSPEIYAEGDVTFVQKEQGTFYCERMIIDPVNYSGFAVGVRLKSGDGVHETPTRSFLAATPNTSWKVDNSLGQQGDFKANALMGGNTRLYASAQELRILNRDHIELINADVSTDSYAKPHWKFNIPAALLRRYEKIEAYNATVRVGDVPVFYMPYFIRDLRYDWPWMTFTTGSSSDWGYFFKSKWGFNVPFGQEWRYFQPERWYFDIDAYSDRGLGLGTSMRYIPDNTRDSWGQFGVYNVFETWTSGSDDRHRAMYDNVNTKWAGFDPTYYGHHNRTTAFWSHYQELNDHWTVLGDLRYYSDPDMPWEYDKDRYLRDRAPGADLNIRRLDRDWALSLYTSKRINTWQTQSEYLPELRLDVPGFQIADWPLYWVQDARIGMVNRRFDTDLDKYNQLGAYADGYTKRGRPDPYRNPVYSARFDDDFGYFFRAFGDTRIEAPLDLGGAAVLKPWVGARYGYYSDTYGDPVRYGNLSAADQAARQNNTFTAGQVRERGDVADGALMAGVDLSTRTYAYFGDGDRWRLMLDPVVGAQWQTGQRYDQWTYYPIDDVENYGRDQVYKAGFYSLLQSRSGGAQRDVLSFSAFVNYYPNTEDQYQRHYGRDFSEIAVDTVWRVTPKFSLWGNALIDTVYGRFNHAEVGGDLWVKEWFRVYAKHVHEGGDPRYAEDNQPNTNESVFAFRNKLWNDNSRYSSEFSITYDWGDRNDETVGGISEYRVSLFRNLWDDFEMSISYAQNRRKKHEEDGGKVDRGIYFTIAPTGVAGYRRPAAVSTLAASHIAESRYGYDPQAEAQAVASLREASRQRGMGLPSATDGGVGGVNTDIMNRGWGETFSNQPGAPLGVSYY